jgi:hypothetical protein
MARYIPTDDMSRFLAREYISARIRAEFEPSGLTVQIGELAEDGACPVHLMVPQTEFDFRTMLDQPQLDGIAWVEDRQAVVYDFGSALGQFLLDHSR